MNRIAHGSASRNEQLFSRTYAGGFRANNFTDPPRQRGVPTSEAAAEALKPRVTGYRKVCLDLFVEMAGHGFIDDELIPVMVERCSCSPQTPRARRVELVDAGLVVNSGRKRRTVSGAEAIVWVAAQFYSPGGAM